MSNMNKPASMPPIWMTRWFWLGPTPLCRRHVLDVDAGVSFDLGVGHGLLLTVG